MAGRRWAVIVSTVVAAVCVAAVLLGGERGKDGRRVELGQELGQTGADSLQALQENVAKLTSLVSQASRHAQDAEEQEQVAREALKHEKELIHDAREQQESDVPKHAGREVQLMDELRAYDSKEKSLQASMGKASLEAVDAVKNEKTLQGQLDAKVNALAAAQIAQFNARDGEQNTQAASDHVLDHAAGQYDTSHTSHPAVYASAPSTSTSENANTGDQDTGLVATLRKKLATLTGTLNMLKETEHKIEGLAGMGIDLMRMPGVQKAVTQSLSKGDLKIAMQIAESLNQTVPDPSVDPNIVAEVAVATEESQKNGVPVPDVNITNLVTPEIEAEIAQAMKEIKIEDDVKKNSRR